MIIVVNGRTLNYRMPSISYRTASMLDVFGKSPKITYQLGNGKTGELKSGDVLVISEGLILTILEEPVAVAAP